MPIFGAIYKIFLNAVEGFRLCFFEEIKVKVNFENSKSGGPHVLLNGLGELKMRGRQQNPGFQHAPSFLKDLRFYGGNQDRFLGKRKYNFRSRKSAGGWVE